MNSSDPRTYTAAIKVAETITRSEFDALVAECRGAVTVFEYNKHLKHAGDFQVLAVPVEDRPTCRMFDFEYCDRKGYTKHGYVTLTSYQPPAFNFYQQGRIVTVAA